jgi:hypothetical protein
MVMQSENAGISGATIEPTIGQMYQACLAFRVEKKKQGAEGSNGELTQDDIQDAVDRVNRMAFISMCIIPLSAAAHGPRPCL